MECLEWLLPKSIDAQSRIGSRHLGLDEAHGPQDAKVPAHSRRACVGAARELACRTWAIAKDFDDPRRLGSARAVRVASRLTDTNS